MAVTKQILKLTNTEAIVKVTGLATDTTTIDLKVDLLMGTNEALSATPITITSFTNSGTTITALTANTGIVIVGDSITVASATGGTTPANLNGTWAITGVVANTSITFVVTTTPGTGPYASTSVSVNTPRVNIAAVSCYGVPGGYLSIIRNSVPILNVVNDGLQMVDFQGDPFIPDATQNNTNITVTVNTQTSQAYIYLKKVAGYKTTDILSTTNS